MANSYWLQQCVLLIEMQRNIRHRCHVQVSHLLMSFLLVQLSVSYKLVIAVSVCADIHVDVSQCGKNLNPYTYRLGISHAQT